MYDQDFFCVTYQVIRMKFPPPFNDESCWQLKWVISSQLTFLHTQQLEIKLLTTCLWGLNFLPLWLICGWYQEFCLTIHIS